MYLDSDLYKSYWFQLIGLNLELSILKSLSTTK